MAQDPDLLSRFNTALGRLQSNNRDVCSDRQKPIVQRTPETGCADFSPSAHDHALKDAATALAALWKIGR